MYKTSEYAHKQRATRKLSNQTDNKLRMGEFPPGKIFLQKPDQELILLRGTCGHMCAVTCTCYHSSIWRPEEAFRSCSITLHCVPLRQGLSVLGAAWRSASATGLRLQDRGTTPRCLHGAEDSNPGPHACAASAPTHGAISSDPDFLFFK